MYNSIKALGVASLMCVSSSTAVLADACSDLVNRAEAGLSQQGLDEASRIQLQELLSVGQAGNVSACQTATTGSLMSPMPAGEHRCTKSDKTV